MSTMQVNIDGFFYKINCLVINKTPLPSEAQKNKKPAGHWEIDWL